MGFIRRLTRGLVVLPGLALVTCGDGPLADAIENCDPSEGQRVLELVNEIRVSEGLGPLVLDIRLATSAQGHSVDMATNNFFSHTGSGDTSAGERMTAAGYPWTGWSENIAAGQSTPESVVNAWMNSQGHRDNILRASSEHVGIGYALSNGSAYGTYWTMNFGSSNGAAEPGSGCHP